MLYLNLNRITEWLFDFLFFLLFPLEWLNSKMDFLGAERTPKTNKKYFIVFSRCFLRLSISSKPTLLSHLSSIVSSLLRPMTDSIVRVRVLYESAVACTDFNHSSLLQWFFNSTNRMTAQQCMYMSVITNGNWYLFTRPFQLWIVIY